MITVDRAALLRGILTNGWLDIQTGEVIYARLAQEDEPGVVAFATEMKGGPERYIRLPHIDVLQQHIHYLELRQFDEAILSRFGLSHYRDLKRDEKFIYPDFYGEVTACVVPTDAEDAIFDGMHDLSEASIFEPALFAGREECGLPGFRATKEDSQFVDDCCEEWCHKQGYNLVGEWSPPIPSWKDIFK